MVRNSALRSEKYGKKVRGLVMPGQSSGYNASLTTRRKLEECVKVAGITPMLQIPYIAFLEELVKHASGNKPDERAIILNKWEMRGLDNATLLALANCAGMDIGLPLACHYEVDANTRALWYLDDGVGGVAADETGTYPLTLLPGSLPSWTTTAKCGSHALHFTPIGDATTNATILNNPPMNGTIEFWFRPDVTFDSTAITSQFLCGAGRAGPGQKLHVLLDQADGTLTVDLELLADNFVKSTQTSWTGGTWYHVAFTWGATGMRLYINGVLDATNPQNGTMNVDAGRVFVLGNGWGYDLAFDGIIDEARMSNVQRTSFLIY